MDPLFGLGSVATLLVVAALLASIGATVLKKMDPAAGILIAALALAMLLGTV